MKKLFLFLVAVSVLFVIGCQENAITDPLSTESSLAQGFTNETAVKNVTPDINDIPEVIKFEEKLQSPYFIPSECFVVSGTINVDHKVFPLDPIPPNPQYRVSLKLCLNAEMHCGDKENERNHWFIKCDTENIIYFTGDEVITLTKYYKIEGRSDKMQLVVRYGVTTEGVSLKDMKLRLPKVHSAKILD